MSFKRNGGILFVSAFGCSMTFARKGRKTGKPTLPRNPVARVRALMVQEESRQASYKADCVTACAAFAGALCMVSAALFA